MFAFICDSVFLFDKNKKLISVPGSAGWCGNHLSNGSITTDLQNSRKFIQNGTAKLEVILPERTHHQIISDWFGYGEKILLV